MLQKFTPCSFQEFTSPAFPLPLFPIHDQSAAQEDLLGVSGQFPAFVQVVIRALLRLGHAVFDLFPGIPDDDIGIRAGQQGALARVQAEDLGRVGGGQGDELVGSQLSGADTGRPQDRQPVLHAGRPLGILVKSPGPVLCRGWRPACPRTGSAWCRRRRTGSGPCRWSGWTRPAHTLPQAGVVGRGAHGRRADPLGPVRAAQVVLGEEQVLRAGLAHHLDAVLAGVLQHVHFAGRRSCGRCTAAHPPGCQGERPQRGLDRPPGRAGFGMPFGRRMPGSQRLGDQRFDHVAVLGMQHDQHAVSRGRSAGPGRCCRRPGAGGRCRR